MAESALDTVLSLGGQVRLTRWARVIPQIKSRQAAYVEMTDEQLRKQHPFRSEVLRVLGTTRDLRD